MAGWLPSALAPRSSGALTTYFILLMNEAPPAILNSKSRPYELRTWCLCAVALSTTSTLHVRLSAVSA